jgi:phosphatidylglycerol:prolipoprotein diacylglycerol transferase
MAVGVISGFLIVWRLAKAYGIKSEQLFDLAFYALIFGLLGARIYYVAYLWDYYSGHLLDILKFWQGGLAVHGIMLGGFGAIFFYARKKKLDFWLWADLIVVGLSFGQIIGRWGNYFNQEVFGRPTDLSWGIPIDLANRPVEFAASGFFHPTFLYESLWSVVIFSVLLIWQLVRIRRQATGDKGLATSDKRQGVSYGNIFLVYLILYSLGRFCNEFLRIDQMPEIFGLRWAQIMSILIFVLVILTIIIRQYKIFKGSKGRTIITH